MHALLTPNVPPSLRMLLDWGHFFVIILKIISFRNLIYRLGASIACLFPLSTCSQARDIFYHDYVVGTTRPFEFLQNIYSPTCKDEHLHKSLDAVALAYLNYQRRSSGAEEEARQSYVSAIGYTSAALQSPGQAKQDTTILAILLLDLYEKITSREPTFHGAWAAHLSGALTLVKLRDDRQFDDPSVIRMLMRLSTNLLISCVASDRPVSLELVALRGTIAAHFPTPIDPKWRESDLMVEFASLRQDIQKGVLSDDEAMLALINLDAKFVRLGLQVPPAWQYKTVQVGAKSNHHYEPFHLIHPAEHVAQMWNTLRLTRILLNELISYRSSDCQRKQSANPELVAIHQCATKAINEMASDICASLPQYIDDPPLSFAEAFANDGAEIFNSKTEHRTAPLGQPDPTRHLPCYRLIFPLFVAAQSTAVPPSLWKWVIKQLRFIAAYHAIENAMSVANILESGPKQQIWNVYAMLGSYAFVC
ncbi:MAG: hypothetical protein LQ343_006991 [Gyalolechia ehrenbergii]|nr:MAG: hypothetical protein LQ343_006991 [Gyalolechia ehrenbergii]